MIIMNKNDRVIVSRWLRAADDAFDELGVIQILVDDANAGDNIQDAVEFVGDDEVGSGSKVFDPLHQLVRDLVDL